MYILFDIGGTNTRVAISRDGESVGDPKTARTPQDFRQGISLIKELAGAEKVKAAAGGIAGPFDKEGVLGNLPNLQGWRGKPFKTELERALGVPVFLGNDTDLTGLGEAAHGAGKGYDIVVYMTVSTGVGGARIVNGSIDSAAQGMEPGHQVIDIGSQAVCGCGGKGHLEALIGGNALELRYGKKPEEIHDATVWDEAAQMLAYGLNNSIVHWSPHIIVLGGPMIVKKPGISLDRVKEYVDNICTIFPVPPIEIAQLGDRGGLYGALMVVKNTN